MVIYLFGYVVAISKINKTFKTTKLRKCRYPWKVSHLPFGGMKMLPTYLVPLSKALLIFTNNRYLNGASCMTVHTLSVVL